VKSVRELPPTTWDHFELVWGERTLVMAIVNATPDSFSDDGVAGDLKAAIALADAAVAAGADIVDVGAESTRPGHVPVDSAEELHRLLPVLERVVPRVSVPISVDTSKADVAEAALDAGASMVNDIRGFTADPELAQVVARRKVPAIVMHDCLVDEREDVVTSVVRELSRRIDRAVAAGISELYLIVDPGFGFGKDWRQNLELLRRLDELVVLGRPILVGTSRKSTIGRVLGLPANDRLEGTLAATALAIARGADVVRVHDVEANVRAARMADAVVRRTPSEALDWLDRQAERR
jgi:dihydropteroate synthase